VSGRNFCLCRVSVRWVNIVMDLSSVNKGKNSVRESLLESERTVHAHHLFQGTRFSH
jgi:hypothetical protein